MKRRLALMLAALASGALMLAACAPSNPQPTTPPPDERGIAYREVDGDELDLDVCTPEGEGPHPAAVLVHGGAFQEGDRGTMRGACQALADAGWAAFPVDYRLLPDTFPAPVDDVTAAVQWLRDPAQVERFGLDGSGPDTTVALLGSSAGAIIALDAAAALGEAGTPVQAVVGLSAAADLTADGRELGSPDPRLEEVVLSFLGCESVEDCDAADAASPATHAAALPPTLLVHGTEELIPLPQAERLVDALDTAGVTNELIEVEGDNHGLQLLNYETRPRIAEFLDTAAGR
jgi:acetyl esterase